MKNIKGLITFLVFLSVITLSVCGAFAMTVQSVERVQTPQPAVGVEQVEPVYLLSWTNSQLSTTQGTFYLTNGIKVINKSGLDQDEIALQENPPIVQFIKEAGQVIEIIFLPNPR